MRHVLVSHMCAVLQPLIHSMPILPNLVSVPSSIYLNTCLISEHFTYNYLNTFGMNSWTL